MSKKRSSKRAPRKKAPQSPSAAGKSKGGKRFVKWFRHWRTGKLIVAADYGYEGFPIG